MRLPRVHFSWSQLALWEANPREYVLKYMLHQPQRVNSGMMFGSYVSEGLETASADAPLALLREKLPAYDTPEKDLSAVWQGIPLVGRADTFREADHAFREYKTGRRDRDGKPPWTLCKARAHGQIAFYGFILWINDKRIPPPAYLDWIETEEKNGVVSLTNHIESFEVPITIAALVDIGARIERAAFAINKQYLTYLAYVSKESQQSETAGVKESAR